jgi:ankyrin repeat protein
MADIGHSMKGGRMSTQPLLPDANIQHLKHQAKDLLKALKSRNPAAFTRVRKSLPRLSKSSDAELRSAKISLADAQFIIAREHGFESWPKLKSHLEGDPLKLFVEAVNGSDVVKVQELLRRHVPLKEKINEPIFGFDSPAIVARAGDRKMVDVLLDAGADINRKSNWWAGGFGVLHSVRGEQAHYLIKRGARVDAYAAARHNLPEKLLELIEADPAVVNAPGPDGMRPLHFAATPEIAQLLLDHGAEIDVRDIDHESTPAQYAIPYRPEVCRFLLKHGAKADIFMACVLGDLPLAKKLLKANPACLQQRIGKGEFVTTKSEGQHIYVYNIGYTYSPLMLAQKHEKLYAFLLKHCSIKERFLHACAIADEAAVAKILAKEPQIASTLSAEEAAALPDAAWVHKFDAVRVMLNAGFDVEARGIHQSTALDRASIRGDARIVDLLLNHGASLTAVNEFGGTPLSACIWGSTNFCDKQGDYPATVERLIKAGAPLPAKASGSPEVVKRLKKLGAKG